MTVQARRDVFQAIADPTRRSILELIAGKKINLNTIAGNFEISRSAVSQHIKILEECGMVAIRQEGRERFCEAKFESLREVSAWVNKYQDFWSDKLNSLDHYLQNLQNPDTNQNQTI